MKLGLWLLIAAVALLWFNHAKKQRMKSRKAHAAQTAASTDADAEQILACAHCGLHVPASDALVDTAGAHFCCEAHRRLHSNA